MSEATSKRLGEVLIAPLALASLSVLAACGSATAGGPVPGATSTSATAAGAGGSASGGSGAGGSGTSPSGTSANPVTTTAPTDAVRGCLSKRAGITLTDNNKSLCITTGTILTVVLRGTESDRWNFLVSSSTALEAHPDPRMTLMVGVTAASFIAVRSGTAVVASTRPPCPMDQRVFAQGGPASASCGPKDAFRVLITIR